MRRHSFKRARGGPTPKGAIPEGSINLIQSLLQAVSNGTSINGDWICSIDSTVRIWSTFRPNLSRHRVNRIVIFGSKEPKSCGRHMWSSRAFQRPKRDGLGRKISRDSSSTVPRNSNWLRESKPRKTDSPRRSPHCKPLEPNRHRGPKCDKWSMHAQCITTRWKTKAISEPIENPL